MKRSVWLAVLVAGLTVVSAPLAFATTVIPSTLAELVDEAHIIVRAHVAYVDEHAGEARQLFRTRIGFEIDETLKGTSQETIETVVPGGQFGAMTMHIPGMPLFTPGQEVLVMIEHTPGGDNFAGLAQGVFTVDRSSGQALVKRDIGSIHFVGGTAEQLNGMKLDTLLTQMRTLVGGVR